MNKNSLKNRFILLAPFLVVFYFSAVILAGGRELDPAELILEKRDPETEVKRGFEGNSDAYGLGIRLGIYIQWFSSLLLFYFLHHDYHSLAAVSNCFQLAMFIALLYMTIKQGPNLQVSEAYLILIFCVGGAFSSPCIMMIGTLRLFQGNKPAVYRAALTGLVQVVLNIAISGYGVWLIFTGMDNMQHPPCSTFGFLFVKVHLYHGARTFWKCIFVFGIIQAVGYPMVQVVVQSILLRHKGTVLAAVDLARQANALETHSSVNTTAGGNPAVQAPTPKPSFNAILNAWSEVLLPLPLFATTIELVIKWNHIRGVGGMGSTGQILPSRAFCGNVYWRAIQRARTVELQNPRARRHI